MNVVLDIVFFRFFEGSELVELPSHIGIITGSTDCLQMTDLDPVCFENVLLLWYSSGGEP
jgi:hypothetical protein